MSHGIVKCRMCNEVIRQCRCMEGHQIEQTTAYEFCSKCAAKGFRVVETTTQYELWEQDRCYFAAYRSVTDRMSIRIVVATRALGREEAIEFGSWLTRGTDELRGDKKTI